MRSKSKRRVSKRRVSKSRVSKRRVSKRRVSKRRVSKRRVSKRRVSKRRVSKRRVSKSRRKRVSKIKIKVMTGGGDESDMLTGLTPANAAAAQLRLEQFSPTHSLPPSLPAVVRGPSRTYGSTSRRRRWGELRASRARELPRARGVPDSLGTGEGVLIEFDEFLKKNPEDTVKHLEETLCSKLAEYRREGRARKKIKGRGEDGYGVGEGEDGVEVMGTGKGNDDE